MFQATTQLTVLGMRLNLKNRVDVGPALLPSKVRQYSGTISELWWWLFYYGELDMDHMERKDCVMVA